MLTRRSPRLSHSDGSGIRVAASRTWSLRTGSATALSPGAATSCSAPVATATNWYEDLSPIQQQLLGGMGWKDGHHQWGNYPQQSPLYGYLQDNGLLHGDNPAQRR